MDWAGPSVLPQKRQAKITAHYVCDTLWTGLGPQSFRKSDNSNCQKTMRTSCPTLHGGRTSDAAAPERRWPSTIAEETVGTRLRTTADARHRCLACRDPRNQSPGSATRASGRPQRPQGRGEAACARGEGPRTATAGGLPVQRAGHEKRSETPRCPAKIHNACVREASRKAACARRGGQRTATAGGLPVRRDGREKESETPRCQAKGLARPQGRGRTRALTAGAMGSGGTAERRRERRCQRRDSRPRRVS